MKINSIDLQTVQFFLLHGYSKVKIAEILGISRPTLIKFMKLHNICGSAEYELVNGQIVNKKKKKNLKTLPKNKTSSSVNKKGKTIIKTETNNVKKVQKQGQKKIKESNVASIFEDFYKDMDKKMNY